MLGRAGRRNCAERRPILHAAGLPASAIAVRMSTSRNAVIGLLNLEGLIGCKLLRANDNRPLQALHDRMECDLEVGRLRGDSFLIV